MKDKNTRKKDDQLKKKRFYLALYSCVGVLAVVAVILAYSNVVKFNNNKVTQENGNQISAKDDDSTTVNKTSDKNIAQSQAEANVENSTALFNKKPKDSETPSEELDKTDKDKTDKDKTDVNKTDKDKIDPDKNNKDVEKETSDAKKEENPIKDNQKDNSDATSEKKDETEPNKDNDEEAVTNDNDDDEQVIYEAEDDETYVIDENNSENYNVFIEFDADKEKMEWPLIGEIVLPFSTDKLVYDKTLEQYRTNDSMCIAAPIGTQVKSTASGVVVQVDNTKENGNQVIIDHGNGWMTTYSQLQDNVLVKLGDVVEKGQVIGGVGNPSIYNVLLGNHLSFQVKKDSVAVNPNQVLMAQQ